MWTNGKACKVSESGLHYKRKLVSGTVCKYCGDSWVPPPCADDGRYENVDTDPAEPKP